MGKRKNRRGGRAKEPKDVREAEEIEGGDGGASGANGGEEERSGEAIVAVEEREETGNGGAGGDVGEKAAEGSDTTEGSEACGDGKEGCVGGCCSGENATLEDPIASDKATDGCCSGASKNGKAEPASCCASKSSFGGKTAEENEVIAATTAATSCCASKTSECSSSDGTAVSATSVLRAVDRGTDSSRCGGEKSRPTQPAQKSKACCSSEPTSSCCSSGPATDGSNNTTTNACKSSSSCCGPASSSNSRDTRGGNAMTTPVFSDSFVDRVTRFKNDRGAALAATHRSSGASRMSTKSSTGEIATLRLCIGGMTCNGCCTRIESFMARKLGIIDVNGIEDMVTSLGFKPAAEPADDTASVVLLLGRFTSPGKAIQLLEGFQGIRQMVPVDDPSPTNASGAQYALLIDYDPAITGARSIVHQLSGKLGFPVQATSPRPQATAMGEEDVRKFTKLLLWSCILALPVITMEFIVPLFAKDTATDEGSVPILQTEIITGLTIRDLVGLLCATPVEFWIARSIHESAYSAIRHSSRVTMDVLISLSSFTAYAFSVLTIVSQVFDLSLHRSDTFFEVTVMLITLILFGRYIEKRVKATASRSVDALLRIQAKTAILLEPENASAPAKCGETVAQQFSSSMKESYIDVVLVERQDLLKVLPGARIPTDGIVVEGASSVDESMLTGESRKVAKEPGSSVIGGTINSQGVLVMRVTHTVTESMLARIVRLVDEAQSSKCVNQSVADGVASYFTTFIILVAVVMFFVWYHLAREGRVSTQGWAPFPFALRFAITILVISCPCAISLAVPTAILVGTTVGAHYGVLFKGGQALEALEGIDVVMFDKTGTLTSANLSVMGALFESKALLSGEFNDVWSYMASAEQSSEHGIGKAIVAHVQHKLKVKILPASGFRAISGCGVQAHVDGHDIAVGSLKWMKEVLHFKFPEEFETANDGFSHHDGSVVVFCAIDGDLKAAVALKDSPRNEAAYVVDMLRHEKIQSWIVTGDQRGTALAVAEHLRIPEFTVLADTLPHQKVEKVRLLQGIGKKVAFVGDGVNDGPALAMANVGIAIGAGADVAIEAADVVLVKDDLCDLLNALHLSRATNRMIRWNFTWAFFYNVVMMPLACGALYPWFGIAIPPALAGLSELLSSVPVILFSLLLNLWKPPFASANTKRDLPHGRGEFVAVDIRSDNCGGDECCGKSKRANEKTPLLSGCK